MSQSADHFVHAFAEDLVQRAGLQLEGTARDRYLAQLEQAVHQRLGVAAFERLGEERVQTVVKDFLHGAPTQQLTGTLQQSFGSQNDFIEKELAAFAEEFLHAVHA